MKPTTKQQQQSLGRFSQYPIIGSIVCFFSADNRMKEAQRALRESRKETEDVIAKADRSIADGEQVIKAGEEIIASGSQAIQASKIYLKKTDEAIAESRLLRSRVPHFDTFKKLLTNSNTLLHIVNNK